MKASPSYGPPLYGLWVCPECSYKNKDYQWCMGPDCNSVKPGGMFDTSQFAASKQPSSDCRRTTISVAMNHLAAAAVRGHQEGLASRRPPPPQQESPLYAAKTNAAASIANLSCKDHCMVRHPPHSPGLPKLAAVLTEGRGLVPDVDHSPMATPCGTGFLE
jgi:hypothetical protein